MLTAVAALVALVVATTAPAEPIVTSEVNCPLKIVEHANVGEVIDGDTVRLSDGRQVRLVGTQAPKLALGRKHFIDWPYGSESKALETLVQGKAVGLGYGGLKIDRN